MKKPYAQSTLKRKLRETGIPKDILEKVHLYLIACANFYRILNIDEVWKVIQRTERRLGKLEPEDFFDADLLESVRFYLMDEFQRQLLDEIIDEDYGNKRVSKDVFFEKLEMREKEYEQKEMKKILHLAKILSTPLTSEGNNFVEGEYEMTREDFNRVIDIKERSCDRYFVFTEDEIYDDGDPAIRYLIDIQSVMDFENGEPVGMDFDEIYEILDRSYDKPLFVPDDLLNYIYGDYFEKTTQSDAMEEFLKKSFISDCDLNDEEFEINIRILMSKLNRILTDVTVTPTEVFDRASKMLEDEGYIFSGFDQVQQFVQLFMDMNNHTRQPVNKGNSPAGMIPEGGMQMPENVSFGPGIQELLKSGAWDAAEMKRDIMTEANLPIKLRGNIMREIDRALEPGEERIINATGTIVKGRKIKPNEPCPCGSGRKYKHCCGRNC